VAHGSNWVEGDLRGPDLDRLLGESDIDLVVHLAARSLVPESMREPGVYFDANVGGVVDLLESMRRHGVQRILFSSSASVYGLPRRVPITEDAPCAPISPYGESKHMVERILHWYGEVHGFAWAALRYFNAAGAAYGLGEDHSPETHLIPIALAVALGRRDELVVYGDDYDTDDGTCIRDYVHVLDLARAHRLAAEGLGAGVGGIYNLGGGRGYSVREVIDMARRVSGAPLAERAGARRAGDPAVLVAAIERARSELAWQPEHDLEAMVTSAWEWHREHAAGYQR
jgi:UDP-glucose 4-epimerase